MKAVVAMESWVIVAMAPNVCGLLITQGRLQTTES
jgi:hypothetical protein